MCAEIIEQFQKCHLDHPIGKFFGECTDLKIKLDRCFRQEVKIPGSNFLGSLTRICFFSILPGEKPQICLHLFAESCEAEVKTSRRAVDSLRYAMRSARSCGFFNPGKTILVPGIYCMKRKNQNMPIKFMDHEKFYKVLLASKESNVKKEDKHKGVGTMNLFRMTTFTLLVAGAFVNGVALSALHFEDLLSGSGIAGWSLLKGGHEYKPKEDLRSLKRRPFASKKERALCSGGTRLDRRNFFSDEFALSCFDRIFVL
nr:COX assembly mitochondrial protein 2 homolog [Ipomoea batatas]